MKLTTLFFILTLLNSCEVYERYFIIASNRCGNVNITVKVKAIYNLPKEYILASKSKMGCTANINLDDKIFTEKISITKDTTKLQYYFNLPVCYTAWLQPSNIGIPSIEYIVIDTRDTVYTNGINYIQHNSTYSFKKHSQQRFLLTIKAP
jgi:hypothetical protein